MTLRNHINLCQANIISWIRQAFKGGKEEDLRVFIMDYDRHRVKDDDELSQELQKKADSAIDKMNLVFSRCIKNG